MCEWQQWRSKRWCSWRLWAMPNDLKRSKGSFCGLWLNRLANKSLRCLDFPKWQFSCQQTALTYKVIASPLMHMHSKGSYNNYPSYTVNLTWLQSSTTEPQQFQYFKLVFLIILNVPIRMVFTETVTHSGLFDSTNKSLLEVKIMI